MTDTSESVGRALYKNALSGGTQALLRNSGKIASGQWADLLTLNSEALALHCSSEDEILDRWIFSADDSLVLDVWSAGRQMVADGRHIKHDQIEEYYKKLTKDLY